MSPTSSRGCGPGWKPSGSASGTWAGRTVASSWDHTTDPSDAVFNGFLPTVARLRELDALTSELVRLRGATQHNCRLCKSLRETTALNAGGSETLYGDIEHFEASEALTDRQKAALRYADALIWSPSRIGRGVAAGIRACFSDAEAVELTFDVMRNASNKIAVALGGDAPRVETAPSSICSTSTVRQCSANRNLRHSSERATWSASTPIRASRQLNSCALRRPCPAPSTAMHPTASTVG